MSDDLPGPADQYQVQTFPVTEGDLLPTTLASFNEVINIMPTIKMTEKWDYCNSVQLQELSGGVRLRRRMKWRAGIID